MKRKKVLITIASILIVLVAGISLYIYSAPRIGIASNQAIENKKNKVDQDETFVASISVKDKLSQVNVFNDASENTLFYKGAGIQSDISSNFNEKDYTFIKGHVETVFNSLDTVKLNDVVEVKLKNGDKLKYVVVKIHTENYGENSKIYTYTNKVGISISTCSKKSKNKMRPELILVVDAILI